MALILYLKFLLIVFGFKVNFKGDVWKKKIYLLNFKKCVGFFKWN